MINRFQTEETWDEAFEPEKEAKDLLIYRSSRARPYTTVSAEAPPSFLTSAPLGAPSNATRVTVVPANQIRGVAASPPKYQQQKVERPKQSLTDRLFPSLQKWGEKQQGAQSQERFQRSPRQRQLRGISGFIYRWFYEEIRLSMSKVSVLSLVIGLMVLGVLFFVIGFLVAVKTVDLGEPQTQPTWAEMNQLEDQQGQRSRGGKSSGGFGQLLGKQFQNQVSGVNKMVGGQFAQESKLIPKALQPFAKYGASQVRKEEAQVVNQVNPFDTRRNPRTIGARGGQQGYQGGAQAYAQPGYSQGSGYASPQGQAGYPPQAYPQQQPGASGYYPQQQGMVPQGGQGMMPPQQQPYGGYGQQPMQQQQPQGYYR